MMARLALTGPELRELKRAVENALLDEMPKKGAHSRVTRLVKLRKMIDDALDDAWP